MDERVVITGIGAVSSIGRNYREFWNNLLAGVSGAKRVTSFDCTGLKRNIGCEVTDFDLHASAKRSIAGFGHASQLAIVTAEEALEDSGLISADLVPDRIGISVGTTMGEPAVIEDSDGGNYVQADAISVGLARYFRTLGPQVTWQNACAAGNYAIIGAWNMIVRGDADVVIAGGSETFSKTAFIGFSSVGALSPDVCRPFDKNRKGLLLGSGSGMLIVEPLSYARRRNARIYAELLGGGLSCDAYHITAPDPDAHGAVLAIKRALKQARINPDDVDYINAHGTGTKPNDRMETVAVKKVFGERRVPISSIKALIGHTMGAAAALEAVMCCMCLKDNVIPPTWNYQEPDPDCDLDVVPNEPRQAQLSLVISNSYAFGGNNSSVVFGRYSG